MVTRKPLPGSANVHPQFTTPLTMSGTQEPSVAVVPDEESTKHLNEPSSDTDSWERASNSEDDLEKQDVDIENASEIPDHTKDDENYKLSARNSDGATDEHDNGEGPSNLPEVMTGDWGDNVVGDTKISETDLPAPAVSGSSETNPFRRKMSQSSGAHSVNAPSTPTEPPPMPLTDEFAKLNVTGPASNPWDELDEQHATIAAVDPPAVADPEAAQDIWRSQFPSQAASLASPRSNLESSQSVAPGIIEDWDERTPKDTTINVPDSTGQSLEGDELIEDSHAWDDVATQDKGKSPMKFPETSGSSVEGPHEGDWNLIESENSTGVSGSADHTQPLIEVDGDPPALPPRNDEKAPMAPPRSPVSAKAETYQVKNINWNDANESKNLRKTPILVQNANGPCPLMALVNALTLTTPSAATEAVLVNTLRTREQISLDLLLNAVFDELMSERRMTEDVSLPDITELYDFLLGLHTGMNVNPRFVPTEEMEIAFKRTSLTHLHPHERGDLIPGTFEDTKEMAFYRIFQIPLIHGWLPSKDEAAYEALKRQAQSYEDAQNILFREEELEDKLSSPGAQALTEEEQAIYQDVLNIKSFLETSATQLTTWGLEVITKAMRPGSVAILFRNDHFSTLYRHPQTLEIFALVTDAGYAGHEEVVWESLCDVNGERSEFYSGDFKIVGGPAQPQRPATSSNASSAQAQRGRTSRQDTKKKQETQPEGPPLSPSEQEDRDLALAMQLQEEEDQRHNAEQAQRRRESQLSEQFIEQQAVRRGPVGRRQTNGNNGNPQGPSSPASQRTTSATNTPLRVARPTGPQQVRSLVPPVVRSRGVTRPADAEADDAPPSYEDAARDRPYVPPAGHPSHPNSSPVPSMSGPRLPPSRAPGVAGVTSSPGGPSGSRRGSAFRQGVPPATTSGAKDKDCVVM